MQLQSCTFEMAKHYIWVGPSESFHDTPAIHQGIRGANKDHPRHQHDRAEYFPIRLRRKYAGSRSEHRYYILTDSHGRHGRKRRTVRDL